jgi:hypothetical protein
MTSTPGEAFQNGAMTYIATGQILGALAFLIATVWIWSLFYRRVGGVGGFSLGMIVGVLFGVISLFVTAIAWPLTLLALVVFAINRAPLFRQRRAAP